MRQERIARPRRRRTPHAEVAAPLAVAAPVDVVAAEQLLRRIAELLKDI